MLYNNPYLYEGNDPIAFNQLKTGDAGQAVEVAIDAARARLLEIYNAQNPDFNSTIGKLDLLYNDLGKTLGAIYLMAFTHPVDDIRSEALANIPVVEKFINEIQLDEKLYGSITTYANLPEAKLLQGPAKRLLENTVDSFDRNGFALPKEQRLIVKDLMDKLADIGNTFDANIASFEDALILPENQLEGLPDDYKQARLQDDGFYRIDMTYPSYRPFMQYAVSDEARKALYLKFTNRAADTNNLVLKDLISTRQELARILGFGTYAEYSLGNKMAKTPSTVWNFESELFEKVKLKADADYQELLAIKSAYIGKPAMVIENWEASFFEQRLLKSEYSIDNELIKEYFQMEQVVKGAFATCEQLFGVSFVEMENAPVWHEEVRAYELHDKGEVVGRFYLDLFPRKNKYGHAAMFPVVSGKLLDTGYSLPVAALVCNFPKPSSERPSLLTHSDVVTFFHEFGHLLHGLLTQAEFSMQAGTSVSRDFVETPSQMFENWAWEYESLKVFAKHFRTGEVLPEVLHQKMIDARNVGSGNQTLQQIFYGSLDMTLHDKWDQVVNFSEIVRDLQNKITNFKYVDVTNFQASFGHLNGYAAGYYGYLWAKVFAEDFFSVFKEKGVFNLEIGQKYRDLILAKGDSEDPADLVVQFLGRNSNPDAFLNGIGLS